MCDGAQSNKSVWNLIFVEVRVENGQEVVLCSIAHPTVQDFKMFFFLDPPHGMKRIRNNFYLKEVVQARRLHMQHVLSTELNLFYCR